MRMEREIMTNKTRFRVYWNGKMYYPGNDKDLPIFWYLTLDGECHAFPAKMGVRFDPAIYAGAIATQRTGLQDRQGCDIYESDIVSYKPPGSFDQDERILGVVAKKKGCYHLRTLFPEYDHSMDQMFMDVKGNIYQNPKLILLLLLDKEVSETT